MQSSTNQGMERIEDFRKTLLNPSQEEQPGENRMIEKKESREIKTTSFVWEVLPECLYQKVEKWKVMAGELHWKGWASDSYYLKPI